jgi:hypothetical protein
MAEVSAMRETDLARAAAGVFDDGSVAVDASDARAKFGS